MLQGALVCKVYDLGLQTNNLSIIIDTNFSFGEMLASVTLAYYAWNELSSLKKT